MLVLSIVVASSMFTGCSKKAEQSAAQEKKQEQKVENKTETVQKEVPVYHIYKLAKYMDSSKYTQQQKDLLQTRANQLKRKDNEKISIDVWDSDIGYDKDGGLQLYAFISNWSASDIQKLNYQVNITGKDGRKIASAYFKLSLEETGNIPANQSVLVWLHFDPQFVYTKDYDFKNGFSTEAVYQY